MSLKSQDNTKTLSFGTTVTIGENADDKSRVFIDDDSVDLIVNSGGTDTTLVPLVGQLLLVMLVLVHVQYR